MIDNTGSRLEERALAALMLTYPSRFRERFGEGMRYALREEAAAARARGRWRWLGFWARTVLTLPPRGLLARARGIAPRGEGHSELRGGGMGHTTRELRLAARRLARRPTFTLAAVGTLALGVGAVTAVFTVVNAVLLAPLPYPDGDRVVRVGHRSSSRLGVPDAGYFHYREASRTLAEVGVYYEASSTVVGTGAPLELGIVRATPSVLHLLGVEPMLGRLFAEEDAEPGADQVAVVAHGYWVRHLGSDPDAIGGDAYEGSGIRVIGVMPPDFRFVRPPPTFVFGNPFEEPDLFLPLSLNRATARFGNFMYQGIGRLAPGATVAGAQRELEGLMFAAAEAFPGGETLGGYTPEGLRENGHRAEVVTVKEAIVGGVREVLWLVMSSVGIVLLIATANVANLLVVRAEARRGEVAIQRALGADRGSLARSFVSESLLLAGLGGALGSALAWGGTHALLSLAPPNLPRIADIGLSSPVLAFAIGVSALSGLALGFASLIRLSAGDVSRALAEDGRGASPGRDRRRLQDVLIVGQVALALVLLVGSGLLVRTFQHLSAVDPGFEPEGVLTVEVSLGQNIVRGAGYDSGAIDADRSRFMLDLVRGLETVPGVTQAAFTGDLPLDDVEFRDHIAVEERYPEEEITLRVFMGPGYLSAVGARLVAGRELEPAEFAGQVRSVVVNRPFAERWWPNQDPIGERLLQYWSAVNPQADVWYTVVGVVEGIRETGLVEPPQPTIYLPTMMLPEGGFGIPISNFIAVLRTSADPLVVAPAVREAIRERYPELPINELSTLEQRTARSFQNISFAMVLLVIAGTSSALLGLVGISGTVAYVVSTRTREFGLRIALGASAWDVERGILRGAAVVGAAGVVIGLLGAALASRVLETLLFEVAPTDPVVYVTTGGGLLLMVLLASLPPARRAASSDPMQALRAE